MSAPGEGRVAVEEMVERAAVLLMASVHAVDVSGYSNRDTACHENASRPWLCCRRGRRADHTQERDGQRWAGRAAHAQDTV